MMITGSDSHLGFQQIAYSGVCLREEVQTPKNRGVLKGNLEKSGIWKVSLFVPTDSKVFRINGGDDGARTRDLCRDSLPVSGFSTTYKPVGNA